jgi:hypothetical protein
MNPFHVGLWVALFVLLFAAFWRIFITVPGLRALKAHHHGDTHRWTPQQLRAIIPALFAPELRRTMVRAIVHLLGIGDWRTTVGDISPVVYYRPEQGELTRTLLLRFYRQFAKDEAMGVLNPPQYWFIILDSKRDGTFVITSSGCVLQWFQHALTIHVWKGIDDIRHKVLQFESLKQVLGLATLEEVLDWLTVCDCEDQGSLQFALYAKGVAKGMITLDPQEFQAAMSRYPNVVFLTNPVTYQVSH